MTDFRLLYDQKPEYVERRRVDSLPAKRVALEAIEYKLPNLTDILPSKLEIDSVAEIGCGTGEIIANFRSHCELHRVGFDISPLNIATAKERFPHVTFTDQNFALWEDNFDVVILSDVIEHVPDDVEFLSAAAKLGKYVLVNLPLEDCWIYRSRQYGPDDPSGHLKKYSLSDGFQLFKDARLEVLSWRQKWPLEEPQERMRQQLNMELTGHRFSGSFVARQGKRFVYTTSTLIKPMGRRLFPSNLFALLSHAK